MKTYFLLPFLILIFFLEIQSQTIENGDLQTRVNTIISNMPGDAGDNYTIPSAMEVSDWDAMLTDLFAANYSSAATKATALGYDLIEFTDNGNSTVYYMLETTSGGTNYWGTYILNPSACRSELVIMSPHPKKDFNTGKQGIYCFITVDAFFFMLSGTSRCNHANFSSCSGSTSVCSGMSESYRISDLAHVDDSMWQKTTEHLHDNLAGKYYAQLHGFTKLSTDPYVIMSNGTRITPNPDKIVSLRDELLVVDNTLTFEIAHLNLDWDRLIGFTNTNGRFLNASANDCTTNATMTDGEFLHIEQEKFKLRNDQVGWHKMAMAMGEAFNDGMCASVAPLPVELVDFEGRIMNDLVQINWTTQSEVSNDFFELEKSNNGIDFQIIARIQGAGNSNEVLFYSYYDKPNIGVNFYRLKQIDFDGNFKLSNIIQVEYLNDAQPRIFTQNGQLFIEYAEPKSTELILFNALGQTILERSFFGETAQFEVENSSMIFYQIKVENQILAGKLFNQK